MLKTTLHAPANIPRAPPLSSHCLQSQNILADGLLDRCVRTESPTQLTQPLPKSNGHPFPYSAGIPQKRSTHGIPAYIQVFIPMVSTGQRHRPAHACPPKYLYRLVRIYAPAPRYKIMPWRNVPKYIARHLESLARSQLCPNPTYSPCTYSSNPSYQYLQRRRKHLLHPSTG